MLRIILFGSFAAVLCQTQSEIIASQVPSCKNPPLCYRLSDTYKADSKSVSLLPYPKSQVYQIITKPQSNLERSYYNGFGSSASPAYYPAFDPISVLASLAFLAFLLQSFASLFDRSRSILPTIVSGRQSSMELKIPDISKDVSQDILPLRKYENLNDNRNANRK